LAAAAIFGEIPTFGKRVRALPTPLRAMAMTKTAQVAALHATFKGMNRVRHWSDVLLLADAPGEISLMELGAAVFIVGTKQPDAPITSARLYGEKDSIKLLI
jgi:hypothetical protein